MKISARLRAVKPSATFAMAAEATALRNQGRDVIDLSVGEPDFDTPEHVKAAAREAMARGLTKYTPIGGTDELKDAISTKLRRDNGLEYGRAEVMASCGGKHSLYTAFQALFDEGDEVVLPAPYWVSYPEMLVLAGAVPRIVTTTAARGFRMAPAELEAALGPRTVAVILNSPSNPTGAAYSAEELRALGRVALRRQLVVITDDIYERLTARPVAHIGTLVPELRANLVVVNSASKSYAMTGWRIGYAVAAEPWMTGLSKATLYSSNGVSTPTQWAALAAFTTSSDFLAASRAAYRERRDLLLAGLNEIGLTCTSPAGAFYAFPDVASISGDSREAANVLLDRAQVATVPGIVFGPHGEGHVRFSFSTSIETIKAGLESMRCNL